ncbi:MAG: hypothetical protein HY319_08320 [Armatimonadetes bacterium]|nr:hypothetical protein [Armatimonadota bacterium]
MVRSAPERLPSLALRRLPLERAEVLGHPQRPRSEYAIELGAGLYCDLYGNVVRSEEPPRALEGGQMRITSQGSQTLIGPPERPAETIIDRRDDVVVVDPPGPDNTTVIAASADRILLNPHGGGPMAVISGGAVSVRSRLPQPQIHPAGPVLASF